VSPVTHERATHPAEVIVGHVGGRAERRRTCHERHDGLELSQEQIWCGGAIRFPPGVSGRDILDCARMESDAHGALARAEASEDVGGWHELSSVGAGNASLQLDPLLHRQVPRRVIDRGELHLGPLGEVCRFVQDEPAVLDPRAHGQRRATKYWST
jgi:hypothetical protein